MFNFISFYESLIPEKQCVMNSVRTRNLRCHRHTCIIDQIGLVKNSPSHRSFQALFLPPQIGPHVSFTLDLWRGRRTAAAGSFHSPHRHRQPGDYSYGGVGGGGGALVLSYRSHSRCTQFLLSFASQPVATGWRINRAGTQNARCYCLKIVIDYHPRSIFSFCTILNFSGITIHILCSIFISLWDISYPPA